MEHWKVLYVGSRKEKSVAELLGREGIEYYLPLIKKMRQWSDRKKMVEMPLFNSYVFVRPTAMQRDKALQVPGVVKYLRYNDGDAQVRENEIELIRTLISGGRDMSSFDDGQQFSAGEEIEVISGPMKGLQGLVMHNSSGQYLKIQFSGMGNGLNVFVMKGEIKKIG